MRIFFYFQFRVRVKLQEESESGPKIFKKSLFSGSKRPFCGFDHYDRSQ
jgi:hypothetical protein